VRDGPGGGRGKKKARRARAVRSASPAPHPRSGPHASSLPLKAWSQGGETGEAGEAVGGARGQTHTLTERRRSPPPLADAPILTTTYLAFQQFLQRQGRLARAGRPAGRSRPTGRPLGRRRGCLHLCCGEGGGRGEETASNGECVHVSRHHACREGKLLRGGLGRCESAGARAQRGHCERTGRALCPGAAAGVCVCGVTFFFFFFFFFFFSLSSH